VNRRVHILSHWLQGRRNGVSPRDIARFLFAPTCTQKARSEILAIEEADDHLVVRLRATPVPMFWPRELDLYALHMVLGETRDPLDWHYYEVPETRVEPHDVVVDCGAAEGIFALLVQDRARQVFAIEPSPRWIAALERTFAGSRNTTVLPYGLGSAPGDAYLSGGALDAQLQASGEGEQVRIETIDSLFFDQGRSISYLKADLEGYEMEMLQGAVNTVARDLPKIAITTYHRADHARQIAAWLTEVDPRYRVRVKGIEARAGAPMMLHAWVDR
jgi:FkbM family methyltransferase